MKKTVLSVFVLILALAMLMTPVFADGNLINLPDESEVQPRAALCPNCNEGNFRLTETQYGPWNYVAMTPYCMDDYATDHEDEWYTRIVTKIYRCDYCGDGDIRYSTQDKYVCT